MTRICAASFLAILTLAGCPAVYPELATRTHALPAGSPLEPPPPPDLRWVKFLTARVPEKARDGRPFQSNGKASAYARLMVNEVELIRTNPEPDTLTPTWPGSPRGNFRFAPTDRLRVELWESHPLNDKPIGSRELGKLGDLQVLDGLIHVEMEEGSTSSGVVRLAFEPAHAVSGLGLWYELRTSGCNVTRTLEQSPAERAGLAAGDEMLRIGGREAKKMTPDEIRSALNAVPFDGIKLQVKHGNGTVTDVILKEGPIYVLYSEFGAVD